MPKASPAVDALPAACRAALAKLGRDLSTARKRRGASLRDWAARLQVSVPTLVRLEKGDPAVSMGVYLTALWLIHRHAGVRDLADPKEDMAALEAEVQRAHDRHRVRRHA